MPCAPLSVGERCRAAAAAAGAGPTAEAAGCGCGGLGAAAAASCPAASAGCAGVSLDNAVHPSLWGPALDYQCCMQPSSSRSESMQLVSQVGAGRDIELHFIVRRSGGACAHRSLKWPWLCGSSPPRFAAPSSRLLRYISCAIHITALKSFFFFSEGGPAKCSSMQASGASMQRQGVP